MRGAELRSPRCGEERIATPVCASVRNDREEETSACFHRHSTVPHPAFSPPFFLVFFVKDRKNAPLAVEERKENGRGNKPRSETFRLCLGAFLSCLYIPGGLPLPLLNANGYFRLPPTSGSGRVPGTHRQALSLAAGAQIFRRRHFLRRASVLFSTAQRRSFSFCRERE